MESNQLSPGYMSLSEMFSSPNSVDIPNFLLSVLWMTERKPRFSSSKMNKIAQLVRQRNAKKPTEDLVDISDVQGDTIEDVGKNSKILVPNSENDSEWVFCGQASLAAAADTRELWHPWNAWSEWSGEARVTCDHFSFCRDEPQDFRKYGLGGRVNLKLLLNLECTRSERKTTAKLSIQQMRFGMETNCLQCSSSAHDSRNESCKWTCGQFFVRKVQITVSPDAWAQNCGELEPSASPTVFDIQSSSGLSVQLQPGNLKNSSCTVQTSKGVSYPAPAFKWDAALLKFSSNAVVWTWDFERVADGTKLDYNTSLRRNVKLGIHPAHTQVSDKLGASWYGLPNVDLQQLQRNWHMTIIVETAVVKGKNTFLKSSHVKEGPTIAFSQDGLTFV